MLRSINLKVTTWAVCLIFLTIGTFYSSTLYNDIALRTRIFNTFIFADILALSVLCFFILKRIVGFKGKGSYLHRQNVIVFTLAVIIPSIIVFFANYLFINMGIEAWFSGPVNRSLNATQQVINGYINENKENLELQIRNLRKVVALQPQILNDLDEFINDLSYEKLEVILFDDKQQVVAKSYLTFALEFEKIPFDVYEQVRVNDNIKIIESEGRIRGLAKLTDNVFILIGRILDPKIVQNIKISQSAIENLKKFEMTKSGFQIRALFFLIVLSLLFVIIAIFLGLSWSDRIMHPIVNLISASKQIKQGNWSIRVKESKSGTEIDTLTKTFNIMLDQLFIKHKELIHEKHITEAIIESLSTGVLVFDSKGIIHLANERAAKLLDKDRSEMIGQDITDMNVKFGMLFGKYLKNKTIEQEQLFIQTKEQFKTIQAHITQNQDDQYIITFDDVTELLQIQKKASWTDMAQRIAHEIKNPLTPIQLSAERLKRRYLKEIESDKTTFVNCVDVIVRQVDSIFNLTKQLSMLANTAPVICHNIDATLLIEKLVTFFQASHPEIQIRFIHQQKQIFVNCNEQQIEQVLINLIKNAIEAINDNRGIVSIFLHEDQEQVTLTIEDNGPGFPKEIRHKLSEPYVTMKKGGTGLGLAIVNKIIESHNAYLAFENSKLGGAQVKIIFTKKEKKVCNTIS